jgi:hypothetical protein
VFLIKSGYNNYEKLVLVLFLIFITLLIPIIILPIINSALIFSSKNSIVFKDDLAEITNNCEDAILEKLLPPGYFFHGDQVHCTSHILRALNLINTIYNYEVPPGIELMKNSIENNRQENLFWRCNEFIPTDIDTTLQALSALNGLSNKSFIYESLDKLTTLQLEDGSFRTWIDVGNYTFEELHTEPDCIENDEIGVVLYYTYILNKSRYNNMLFDGAEYISTQQNFDGTWQTPWYLGDYYGIYKIGSFLALYNKTKYFRQLNKSYWFIMNNMNPDGGWGRENGSNPLDTAYCITFLIHYKNDINLIQKGLRFLMNSQEPNGLWPDFPFYEIIDEPTNLIFGPNILVSAIILETMGIYLKNFNIK